MKYDYITRYDTLKAGLDRDKFVQKNKHHFSRETDECILSIDFIHSVPKPKVKDYNIVVSIEYPKAVKIGQELDVFTVGGIGANIGYLSPLNAYKVWRIGEIDDEKQILTTIDEMLVYIEKYALPFLKKYSVLENTIHEIEVGNRLFMPSYDYNLPILYLLNNEKNHALSFITKELSRKEQKVQKEYDDNPFPDQISFDNNFLPNYRALNEYKEFARKFYERFNP